MTFLLHALVVVGAIFVKELTIIFDLISVFGNSTLLMVIPSLFVIFTQNYFPRGRQQQAKCEGKVLRVLAYIVIAIGVVNFVLGVIVVIKRITNPA